MDFDLDQVGERLDAFELLLVYMSGLLQLLECLFHENAYNY